MESLKNVYENPEYADEIHSFLKDLSVLRKGIPMLSYLEIRRLVGVITNHENFKKAVTCGTSTNCSFCCHDTIIMGKIEAEHIKRIITTKGIVPNKHRVEQQNNNPNIKWIDKACPLLLDENEKGQRLCSIYEERPLICRTHNSTIDPIECNREHNPTKVIREAKTAIIDALSFTNFMLGNGSKAKDPSDTLVKMHKMLSEMKF